MVLSVKKNGRAQPQQQESQWSRLPPSLPEHSQLAHITPPDLQDLIRRQLGLFGPGHLPRSIPGAQLTYAAWAGSMPAGDAECNTAAGGLTPCLAVTLG